MIGSAEVTRETWLSLLPFPPEERADAPARKPSPPSPVARSRRNDFRVLGSGSAIRSLLGPFINFLFQLYSPAPELSHRPADAPRELGYLLRSEEKQAHDDDADDDPLDALHGVTPISSLQPM